MKALFYISSSIGEDNILWGMLELQYDVVQSSLVVDLEKTDPVQIEIIAKESSMVDFVITRDFSVNVAEGCHISGTPYISWCYDAPVMALYRREALYATNYVFVFDRMHYIRLKELGLRNVYYQPLAANMTKAELTVITPSDISRNYCDVSFVGSMYNKGFYDRFKAFASSDIIDECEEILSGHLCRWNSNNTICDELSDMAAEKLYSLLDDNREVQLSISNKYLIELMVLIPELTSRERFYILNSAARKYKTVLHTHNPESVSKSLLTEVCPSLDQLSEDLYKTYAAAKINLNLTMRSIETGVPQRVFDIMSIGGCVFSNYQAEAAELFEPDKEIILFSSSEEFCDKAEYYLKHEKDRLEICRNGHSKVKECYNYPSAISNMISKL